jgi:hypothetical protein
MIRLAGTFLLTVAAAAPLSAQAHVLIVSGLGGEPRYVEEFHEWGTTMVDAARDRLGLPPGNVVYLAENPARDPRRIDGVSRKEEVESAFRSLASRAGPDDRILVILIGHGSTDSRGARLNLPGPDLTAEEYAALLSAFTQPVVFVNTGSASGGFQDPLAGPNRTIITATRTGNERTETIFGKHFIDAFASEGADADRDGRVTIVEAFEYARRETERDYASANRLQMEHARMEGDLQLARMFSLGGGAAAPATASAEVRELYERRRQLEERIVALRARGEQMESGEYQRELETLLLELARTNRQIQEQEEGN